MKTRRKLLPGRDGTKRWVEEYGKSLICVRYRYDEASQRRFTTVELIVAEAPWRRRIRKSQIMNISVKYIEIELRGRVRAAGGRWNWEKRLWELPYGMVVELGLKERIVDLPSEARDVR